MTIMAPNFQTEGFYLLVLLILTILLIVIFKNFNQRVPSNTAELPPGPTPWPFLGNIPHIRNITHISLAKLAEVNGPIMSFKLPNNYLIVGSSKAVAMEILKKHDHILSGRYSPSAYPYTREELNRISVAWTGSCNERWKYLRALCKTELFSVKELASQEWLREKKMFELVEFLKANEGKVVNIRQLVFVTVFNMLSNVLLSRDLISLEEEIEDSKMKALMRRVVDVLSAPNISDLFPALSGLDLQGLRRKAKKLWKEIWYILKPIVEERRKRRNNAKQDFLDILVAHDFADDELHELLVEFFSAGSDTSTSTIEWLMAELVKNPEAMKNLQEELEKEINEDMIKESQLIQLPYLQACVKETLRLHPAAPFLIPRKALETCRVMNYTIPKDSQILINVWAIGRDPTTWEDPARFKPERFLNSSIDFKGNNFEFLPFGGGRRICVGYSMATRIIPLTIASMVHFFDWSHSKGTEPDMLDMDEGFALTLEKKHPLVLVPRGRR